MTINHTHVKNFIDWDAKNDLGILPGDRECVECEIVLKDGQSRRVFLVLQDTEAMKTQFHNLRQSVDSTTTDRVAALVSHLFSQEIPERHVTLLPASFYSEELRESYGRPYDCRFETIPVFHMQEPAVEETATVEKTKKKAGCIVQ